MERSVSIVTDCDVAAANDVARSRVKLKTPDRTALGAREEVDSRPSWITPELLESTERLLATNSPSAMSEDDIIQTLMAIGTLLDATQLLALEVVDEEVHGIGKSQQP